MPISWFPTPTDLVRAAARHDYTSDTQPDLTGYLLMVQSLHDGAPYSRRGLGDLMGGGSSRAGRVILRARADYRSWAGGGTLSEPLGVHDRTKASPRPNHSMQVQSLVLQADEPRVNQSESTSEPLSCARDPYNIYRTGQNTSAPNGAAIQEEQHGPEKPNHRTVVEPEPRHVDASPSLGAAAQGGAAARQRPVADGASAGGAEQQGRATVDLKALWAKVNDITPGRPLKLTNARRASLKARAGEHSAEDVLTVVRWVHNSDHKRAMELREGGWTKPETYLRPRNFIAYLEFAEEGRHDETPNNGKQRPLPTGEPTRLFV